MMPLEETDEENVLRVGNYKIIRSPSLSGEMLESFVSDSCNHCKLKGGCSTLSSLRSYLKRDPNEKHKDGNLWLGKRKDKEKYRIICVSQMMTTTYRNRV